MPAELQQPITIINEIPGQDWWQVPLLVLLGGVLTLGATLISAAVARHHERSSERDLLLMAFLAEVQVNARTLKNAVRVLNDKLDRKRDGVLLLPVPFEEPFRPKTAVFNANLNRLGHLRDPKLTEQIAITYSHFETMEAAAVSWRQIPDGEDKPKALRTYWKCAAAAAHGTTLLSGYLELQTEHLGASLKGGEESIPESTQKDLSMFIQVRDRLESIDDERTT